jgi:hypothetical protein
MGKLKTDDTERRLRLVSLAYEVLRDMKTPADGTTDEEMCSLLSQTFLEVMVPLEADAPKEREGTFMFSRLDEVPASFLRRHRH